MIHFQIFLITKIHFIQILHFIIRYFILKSIENMGFVKIIGFSNLAEVPRFI
jgi:hypothetical protein